MGYIRHDALIITGTNSDMNAERAEGFRLLRELADAFEGTFPTDNWKQLLIGPIKGVTNFTETMVLCPDGSQEGWGESDAGDALRAQLIDIAESHDLDWVAVSFGGDDPELAHVTGHNLADLETQ